MLKQGGFVARATMPDTDRLAQAAGWLAFALLAAALWQAGAHTTLALFSPDSWSYDELARTVFGGDFFRYTTRRSYLPGDHSASFPLGYPVLLAFVHLVAGDSPRVAVGLNAALTLLTVLLVHRSASLLKLPRFACFCLAAALPLWPPYLDELFAGRSMPAALFFYALAVHAALRRRHLACGCWLGLAALCRFDFLLYGLLFLLGTLLMDPSRWRRFPWLVVGFAIGLAPWIGYSLSHFGRFWVSDNSWVALNAAASNVLDYPAASVTSVATHPAAWLLRVTENARRIFLPLGSGIAQMPLLSGAAMYLVLGWSRAGARPAGKVAWLVLLLPAGLGPYLLTGYFDTRYFALVLLLATAGLLVAAAGDDRNAAPAGGRRAGVLLLALLLSVAQGGHYLQGIVDSSARAVPMQDAQIAQIEFLRTCHARHPQAMYIFGQDMAIMGTRYGATTGQRAALIASNFNRMSPPERSRYLQAMEPYVLVDASVRAGACPVPR